MLEVAGLRLRLDGRPVLAIDRFGIAEGEVKAVVGPNGAGKSSLLLALALLLPARFDQYRFDHRPAQLPRDALALRRQMAVVFQEPLLLDSTVLGNVAQGLLLRGVAPGEADRRAAAWLERLGVQELSSRPARSLSGGEAKRVSLARALALSPRLLLLDEPFAALDVLTRGPLLSDLRAILREHATTALLVTHDITEVALLADRVAVMEAGRVVQEGEPAEVFADPQSGTARRMAQVADETAAALHPLTRLARRDEP